MPPLIDLTGQKFGRLRVLARSPGLTNAGYPTWNCICECGTELTVSGKCLKRGHQKSCGCLRKETSPKNAVTHGHTRKSAGRGTPEYNSWKSMIQRCLNLEATGHERYGECGIKVCDRWLLFENFLSDMGLRPPGHSLDRFPDKHGNYEPGNVRWATPLQQASNKRRRADIEAARRREREESG